MNQTSLNACLDGLLVHLSMEPKDQPSLDLTHKLQLDELLAKYTSLFQNPQGLPPKRSIEHKINLCEGQGPICVRPYRYPHIHNDEIQRQVREMLQMGII